MAEIEGEKAFVGESGRKGRERERERERERDAYVGETIASLKEDL